MIKFIERKKKKDRKEEADWQTINKCHERNPLEQEAGGRGRNCLRAVVVPGGNRSCKNNKYQAKYPFVRRLEKPGCGSTLCVTRHLPMTHCDRSRALSADDSGTLPLKPGSDEWKFQSLKYNMNFRQLSGVEALNFSNQSYLPLMLLAAWIPAKPTLASWGIFFIIIIATCSERIYRTAHVTSFITSCCFCPAARIQKDALHTQKYVYKPTCARECMRDRETEREKERK